MNDELKRLLVGLKADIEAMIDTDSPDEDEEFYLSGFGVSYMNDDGEAVVSWPNLKVHLDQIEQLLIEHK